VRFDSADRAVRWWLRVHAGLIGQTRSSTFWERLRGEWADRCGAKADGRSKPCTSTTHAAKFSKTDNADVERCTVCGALWKTKGRGKPIQVGKSKDYENHELVAFYTIGRHLAKLPAKMRETYLAFLEPGSGGYMEVARKAGLSDWRVRQHCGDARGVLEVFLKAEGLMRGTS
jgi:hypothetical protein